MKALPRISQARVKAYHKLTQKKFRASERMFLAEGARLVEEALKSDWSMEAFLVTKAFREEAGNSALIGFAEEKRVPSFEITEQELQLLSDTVSSQGVVGVVGWKETTAAVFWARQPKRMLIVALEGLSDPGNVGTILRTCDWFGIDGVLLGDDTVELYNPKVVRATMGSLFHLNILSGCNLEEQLSYAKTLNVRTFVTALSGGTEFPLPSYPDRSVIVFGNEAHGISSGIRTHADTALSIPRFGSAESLNVAITCGIIVGHWKLSCK